MNLNIKKCKIIANYPKIITTKATYQAAEYVLSSRLLSYLRAFRDVRTKNVKDNYSQNCGSHLKKGLNRSLILDAVIFQAEYNLFTKRKKRTFRN